MAGLTLEMTEGRGFHQRGKFKAKSRLTRDQGERKVPLRISTQGKLDMRISLMKISVAATVLFASCTFLKAQSFAPRLDIETGREPLGLAIADFDGDGKADLAVSIYDTGTGDHVSVFQNTSEIGAVSFTSAANFQTGRGPEGIAAGDLDGDGKLDLVSANAGDGTLSILHNTSQVGTISFDTVAVAVGGTPHRVRIADLNRDGTQDLAVSNNSGRLISVFLNHSSVGSIVMDPRYDFPVASYANELWLADVDGDGRQDIAAPIADENVLSIFLNTSDADFVSSRSPVNLRTGRSAAAVAAGDLEGDGDVDLIVANYGSDSLSIFTNMGNPGSFSMERSDLSLGAKPQAIALGDLDGDGRLDAVVAGAADNAISILHNDSTSTEIAFSRVVDLAAGPNPFSVDLGDLDGDSIPDIVVVNHEGAGISIFRGISGSSETEVDEEGVGSLASDTQVSSNTTPRDGPDQPGSDHPEEAKAVGKKLVDFGIPWKTRVYLVGALALLLLLLRGYLKGNPKIAYVMSPGKLFVFLVGGLGVGLFFVFNQYGPIISRYMARVSAFDVELLAPIWTINSAMSLSIWSTIASLLLIGLGTLAVTSSVTGGPRAYLQGVCTGYLTLPFLAGSLVLLVLLCIAIKYILMAIWYVLSIIAAPFRWISQHIVYPLLRWLGTPVIWVWENIRDIVLLLGSPFVWLWHNVLAPLAIWIYQNVLRPLIGLLLGSGLVVFFLVPFGIVGLAVIEGFRSSLRVSRSSQHFFCNGVTLGLLLFDASLLVALSRFGLVGQNPPIAFIVLSIAPLWALLRLLFVGKAESDSEFQFTWAHRIGAYWKSAKMEVVATCFIMPVFLMLTIVGGHED